MKKLFVLAASAAMIFASCTKDGGNDNGSGTNSSESRMGISFTLPRGAATRAEVAGVGKENEVDNITVFIFDGSGNPVPGSATTFAATTANFTIEDNTFTLKSEKEIVTTAGTRTIYIAANLVGGFTSQTTEAVLKVRKLEMAEAVTENNIVMFSDAISQTIHALGAIEGDEPTAAEIAANADRNKVTTDMKRLVSKVVVTSAAELTQEFKGEGENGDEEFDVVYTVGNWGIQNSLSTVYAVKGERTTGDYTGFTEGALPKTLTTSANAQTTQEATEFAYIFENIPYLNGELVYAMIQAKADPEKVAEVQTVEEEEQIVWVDADFDEDAPMWVVKSVDGKVYFCDSETDKDDVLGLLDEGAEETKYPGRMVYFSTYINHHAGNEKAGVIARNEFIHLNLTGVKGGNVFGGTPGKEPDGGIPEIPGIVIPPDEPIVKQEAYLTIDVSVAPWAYEQVSVTLE